MVVELVQRVAEGEAGLEVVLEVVPEVLDQGESTRVVTQNTDSLTL